MNDKIKQLAEQAGIKRVDLHYTEEQPPYTIVSYRGSPDNSDPLAKFARLIVRECVDICNQAILQNQDTLSKLNVDELAEKMVIHGSINQAQKLGKGIKEHFGVKE